MQTQILRTLRRDAHRAGDLRRRSSGARRPRSGQARACILGARKRRQNLRLASFAGKFVVLEWLNHGCPFVKKHYGGGNMQALQKEYTAKGVVWLSIISSAPGKQGHSTAEQANAATKEQGAQPTVVLLDESGAVGHLYDATTTPDMFVIDPSGTLIYAGAIDDQPSFDPETRRNAKNYVRAALDEAMAGKPVTTPATKSYGCGVKY